MFRKNEKRSFITFDDWRVLVTTSKSFEKRDYARRDSYRERWADWKARGQKTTELLEQRKMRT